MNNPLLFRKYYLQKMLKDVPSFSVKTKTFEFTLAELENQPKNQKKWIVELCKNHGFTIQTKLL
jgi:hypothetical protein